MGGSGEQCEERVVWSLVCLVPSLILNINSPTLVSETVLSPSIDTALSLH